MRVFGVKLGWPLAVIVALVAVYASSVFAGATASTVTGIDYSTMYSVASSELLDLLPPIVAAGVAVFIALWALRKARQVFKIFAGR